MAPGVRVIEMIPSRAVAPELTDRYGSEGWWTSDTLGALLCRALEAQPDAPFRVHSTVRPYDGTFGEVEQVARRLAAGLHVRGVRPGDVVAFQLPNWMEAAAIFWASTLLGAVVVPIVHFYGRKEVGYILAAAKPKVFITTEQFGRMTFHPDLCVDVPIVGLVGGGFEDLLADEPLAGAVETDPSNPALIAFTSGTTRDPKGVVHSHQTLGCEIRQLNAGHPKHPAGSLTALPVGHFIGMLGGLLCPVLEGVPIHLADTWDPTLVLTLMAKDGIGFGGGPAYFITSLIDHPEFTEDHLQYMRYLGLGGSAIPTSLTRRLTDLGLVVTRSYGSTEHPSITGSSPTAEPEKRLLTDGAARGGVEIRLASDGEILSRGPDLCIGYLDSELTAKAFDDEGWYHTGDVGVFDDDGYLAITDRISDVIIRGGENISASEVEAALEAHPDIHHAVAVGYPDALMGERVAAFVESAAPFDLESCRRWFADRGVAKFKTPERVERLDRLPLLGSGKPDRAALQRRAAAG
jgi:acyl-CoA synthetase